jgi:hypothetical protein
MGIPNAKAAKEHMTGWIAGGQRLIDDKVEVWREIMANVLVTPYADENLETSNPYGKSRQRDVRNLVLKDPESTQIAETFRANMMGALFGDAEGKYIIAEPRGFEDAVKAKTVTRLLRYDFALPGVIRTMSEAMLDLAMFGTVVLETPWRLEERNVVIRTVEETAGISFDTETRDDIVTYDDPEINQIDLLDWYPDVDETRIEKMRGAAKGFRMTPSAARFLAEDEDSDYDLKAVERAISNAKTISLEKNEQRKRDVRHRRDNASFSFDEDFSLMKGYEYWGEVSFGSKDKIQRRVITMLNGVVVRNAPWPLTDPDLPFHVLVINPVKGRHYGKAPAEVVRYSQDFADAMLMLIAEATVRQVHPPLAIDISKDIDPAAVRAWEPDAIIAVDGDTNGAVSTIQYGANIWQGTQFQNQLKQQMREGSGALGATQGLGIGVNRASATEAAGTMQKAMTQIEAAAALLEKDGLPQIGRGLLRRNQQFLDDNEALRERVGEVPESVWLGDIMGDFDVHFVGTRNAISKQMKLQAYDRLIALSQSNPAAAQRIPWDLVFVDLFGDVLNLPEVAAIFAAPKEQQATQAQNLIAQMMDAQAGGTAKGSAPASQAPGLGPQQAAGAMTGEGI